VVPTEIRVFNTLAEYPQGSVGIPGAELELHDALIRAAPSILGAAGKVIVVPEISLAYGRPDIVAAEEDDDAFERRRRAGLLPCISQPHIDVAVALRRLNRPASLRRIAASTGLTVDRLPRTLNELARAGLVVRVADLWLVSPDWTPLTTNLHAIEAKVEHWQRALQQASAWASFVDSAWLAFPTDYLRSNVPRSVPALRPFGLLSVDDSNVRVVRRPRRLMRNPVRRAWAEEYLYRRWLAEVEPQRATPKG
jgi:hypothetical protein